MTNNYYSIYPGIALSILQTFKISPHLSHMVKVVKSKQYPMSELLFLVNKNCPKILEIKKKCLEKLLCWEGVKGVFWSKAFFTYPLDR